MRWEIRTPVIITSGYRCSLYNQEIGGIKSSYHLLGMAADIYVPGISLINLLKISEEIGFKGIGFYPERNFLHLDIRTTRKARWQG